jgi:hypothetical protein
MWIIPKTLSAFVQDTEGLNLDLEERAWMCAQSLMSRSKPSAAPTWLRRLKKDEWMTHLSGRILKPSQQKYFEEKFTASLEDIPASRSVAQESEKERKTQDTCGHTSEAMSGQLDLFGASLKMSEATPRWGYGESCPIWKKMVTERSGDCSQRRKQARLTNASECSSWQNYPTPAARDYKGTNSEDHVMNKSKGYKGHMNQLPNFIKYSSWPTPRAGNPGSRKPGTGGKILAEEAKKNWATPQSTDGDRAHQIRKRSELSEKAKKGGCRNLREDVFNFGPPAQEKSSTSGKNQESWPTPRVGGHEKAETSIKRGRGVSLTGAVAKDATQTPKLNPNWVEQLMGLPIGWTDLGSWATESSHKQQN